jgi:hypothetical protein
MKKYLFSLASLSFWHVHGQNITYTNFSKALNTTNVVSVANNTSYNTGLSKQTGNGINWNASGLTMQAGTPSISLGYFPVSSTPHAALYPAANYSEYDPALTSVIEYRFTGFSKDSVVEWGSYSPSSKHEIFQNPDKHLIFPMTLGDTFRDNYRKTNYSNSSTVSSYQTGNRTVVYAGLGTLVLPHTSFTNVALVTELRTSSLGPDSYEYTWYELSTGKKLLYRSENGSSITTVYTTQFPTSTGLPDKQGNGLSLRVYPNPAHDLAMVQCEETIQKISILDAQGRKVKCFSGMGKSKSVSLENLKPGVYFIEVQTVNNTLCRIKLLLAK